MNEQNFEIFARWVRDRVESRNQQAAHSARWLAKDLEKLAQESEQGNNIHATVESTLWPRTIANLREASIMAEILEWVEAIEEEKEGN